MPRSRKCAGCGATIRQGRGLFPALGVQSLSERPLCGRCLCREAARVEPSREALDAFQRIADGILGVERDV